LIDIAFIAICLTAIIFALVAVIRVGFARLDSFIGIWGDGISPGRQAPGWLMTDLKGVRRGTPSGSTWQVLVFADHSLRNYPDLLVGLDRLAAFEDELEIVILPRPGSEHATEEVLTQGEQSVPIVPSSPTLYNDYRVRVMPFVFVLDPNGIVRSSGVPGFEATLVGMLREAGLPTSGPAGQFVWNFERVAR
jgi:hypothetical protein